MVSVTASLARWFRPVPILLYHFLDGEREKQGLSVSTASFERHILFLLKGNFHVLSLERLVEWLRGRQPIPPNSVVITFDDGDEAFYTKAYPLLLKYRLPATVFVITGWIGKPGYLGWDELRGMSPELVTVGSHAVTHRYLPDLSLEEMRAELGESKKVLEEGLRRPVHFLSYPVGGFGPEIARVAREAGYLAACTTNRGRNFFQKDLLALKRIKMTEQSLRPYVLWAKCSGYYPVLSEVFPKHPGARTSRSRADERAPSPGRRPQR